MFPTVKSTLKKDHEIVTAYSPFSGKNIKIITAEIDFRGKKFVPVRQG
ncbi:hypothetical protein [Mucilaginibacter segetis]|uniref:Uncharacterized protein n=1 Tax=Mucilaginibacter segetis TaxID=2793071 RepID=A0A934PSN1_9SPHI|nr:hypothetical protein [Mucilaginibacter segetis]MBK0378886.1 hypothetical protein [Mucilaginibacter segetis]